MSLLVQIAQLRADAVEIKAPTFSGMSSQSPEMPRMKTFTFSFGNLDYTAESNNFAVYAFGERIGLASTDAVEKMIASEWMRIISE